MLEIKVGFMPGKLTSVAVQEGITAQEIFDVAEITVGEGYEIRLDGNKISLDTCVHTGSLLVAMRMIKGNAHVLKVGLMPGKLVSIEVDENIMAYEAFEKAGIDPSNYEIRLDGEKISLQTSVGDGSLLVAMKQIKGNCDCACAVCECEDDIVKNCSYIAYDLTTNEIEMLLEVPLPTVIEEDFIEFNENSVIIGNGVDIDYVTVDKEMFLSIYTKVEEVTHQFEKATICEPEPIEVRPEPMSFKEVQEIFGKKPVEGNFEKRVINTLDEFMEKVQADIDRYQMWLSEAKAQKEILIALKDELF